MTSTTREGQIRNITFGVMVIAFVLGTVLAFVAFGLVSAATNPVVGYLTGFAIVATVTGVSTMTAAMIAARRAR